MKSKRTRYASCENGIIRVYTDTPYTGFCGGATILRVKGGSYNEEAARLLVYNLNRAFSKDAY
jgi:hypothetical protein